MYGNTEIIEMLIELECEYTQAELSEKLNISRQTITTWWSGKKPQPRNLVKLNLLHHELKMFEKDLDAELPRLQWFLDAFKCRMKENYHDEIIEPQMTQILKCLSGSIREDFRLKSFKTLDNEIIRYVMQFNPDERIRKAFTFE